LQRLKASLILKMRQEQKAQTDDAGMGGVLRRQSLGSPQRISHALSNPMGVICGRRHALCDLLVESLL
jgi:hypothetical protein